MKFQNLVNFVAVCCRSEWARKSSERGTIEDCGCCGGCDGGGEWRLEGQLSAVRVRNNESGAQFRVEEASCCEAANDAIDKTLVVWREGRGFPGSHVELVSACLFVGELVRELVAQRLHLGFEQPKMILQNGHGSGTTQRGGTHGTNQRGEKDEHTRANNGPSAALRCAAHASAPCDLLFVLESGPGFDLDQHAILQRMRHAIASEQDATVSEQGPARTQPDTQVRMSTATQRPRAHLWKRRHTPLVLCGARVLTF